MPALGYWYTLIFFKNPVLALIYHTLIYHNACIEISNMQPLWASSHIYIFRWECPLIHLKLAAYEAIQCTNSFLVHNVGPSLSLNSTASWVVGTKVRNIVRPHLNSIMKKNPHIFIPLQSGSVHTKSVWKSLRVWTSWWNTAVTGA